MTGQYRLEVRGSAIGQSKLPSVEQLTQELIILGKCPSNDTVKHLSDVKINNYNYKLLSDVTMYSCIKRWVEPKVITVPVSSVWRGRIWYSWWCKLQFMIISCIL